MGAGCTSDYFIEAVQMDADGTTGPIQAISPSGEYTDGPEEIGIDSAGTVTVVWTGGYEPGRLLAIRIAADGTVGELRQLSRTGEDPAGVDVLTDSRDRVTVAWSDYEEAPIRARRINTDGTVGRLREVSSPGMDTANPSLVLDARDRVTVGWTDYRSGDPGHYRARVARLHSDLSGGRPQALTSWRQDAGLAEVVFGGSDILTAFTTLPACCGYNSRIQMLRTSGGR